MKLYNKRGVCQQWIKEGIHALNRTRLSCRGFAENEVRLKLFIMAYNSGNIFSDAGTAGRDKGLVTQDDTIEIDKPGRLIRHARYYYLLLAETLNRCAYAGRYHEENKLPQPRAGMMKKQQRVSAGNEILIRIFKISWWC